MRALVEPTVNACMRGAGPERHYARILLHTFALRQPFVDEAMAEQNDRVPKASSMRWAGRCPAGAAAGFSGTSIS